MRYNYSLAVVCMSVFCLNAGAMEPENNKDQVIIPEGLVEGMMPGSGLEENFSNAVDRWNWKLRGDLAKCVATQFKEYNQKIANVNYSPQFGTIGNPQKNIAEQIARIAKTYQARVADCWTKHKDDRHEEPKQPLMPLPEELEIQHLADENPEAWSMCDPRTWSCFKNYFKQKQD